MNKAIFLHIRLAVTLSLIAILAVLFPSAGSHAADSLCAEVKIEIRQELTLERQAFDAHMRINNGLTHIALEDVGVTVHFSDADGNPVLASSDPGDTSARFFIRVDSLANIGDVSGSGTVSPETSADIHWLIIPSPGASNGLESGTLYYVGATLTYTLGGEANQTHVSPDYIYVKPMPEITLDYFLPEEVYGDDAFTTAIEAPVPFSLGVRVRNSGHGTARNLQIDSAQPVITENEQGLLIGFTIEGSWVNDQPVAGSLLADFGDIPSGTAGMARWIMTCTLSGKFTSFEADFSHADELGGELTSLIDTAATHTLVHDVIVDLPGRDGIFDFLAKDGDIYRVYESDTVDTVVTNHSASATLTFQGNQGDRIACALSSPAGMGFVFLRLPDPFNGTRAAHSAIRSDGKAVKSDNIWLSKSRDGQNWNHFVNLFDAATTGAYTVFFADPAAVPQSPVLQFIADVISVENEHISFIVQASDPDGTVPALSADSLPVGATLSDQGDGSALFDWTPAVGQAGSYGIVFRASDGSLHATRRATLTVRRVDDTDGDGMSDAWELAHFGTLDRDGSGDFDGDGISDLDEFLSGSDPTSDDHAPGIPAILSPLAGASVSSLTPVLIIENSMDADGDPVAYEFEVYGDTRCTVMVAAGNIDAQTGDTTTWTLPVDLEENQHYFWRVRAGDGYSYSLWAYGRFFVDTVNDSPGAPAVSFPPDGTDVDSLTPTLSVLGASDPDEEVLTCAIEIYADAALSVAVASITGLVPGDAGTVDWTVDTQLDAGSTYYWQAVVTDGRGLSASSPVSVLTVDTANQAPAAPVIALPADGSAVAANDVTLTVDNAIDADGDPLAYDFEIDTHPGFAGDSKQISHRIDEGTDTTAWTPASLQDNTVYYWRARATDGAAFSPWAAGHFTVNTVNDRPAVCVPANPGQDAWATSLRPDLCLTGGTDPDGDALTYRHEVYSDPALENLVAWNESTDACWTVSHDLTDRTRYYWRARAVDIHGLDGSWMPTASFFVRETEAVQPDAITVRVSTDTARPLDGIHVYAFTAAGAYIGVSAITTADGTALFDIGALPAGTYRFRADYLGSRFWSDTVSIPGSALVPIVIAEEAVTVTVDTASGPAGGVRVYLFSESGTYLGVFAQTDDQGQVCFDLPEGQGYRFRADILGSQYWSETLTVEPGAGTSAMVDAGGGRLQAMVRRDETTPMEGVRVYLFSAGDTYLGVHATSDADGYAAFDVTAGEYKLRADYLGSRFWSDAIQVVTDTAGAITIAHQPVQLTVQGRFGEEILPLDGIRTYLFSDSGAYLGQTLTTDENGQAVYNLPEKRFTIRADYLGGQYWSQPFTWTDPVVTLALADGRVQVAGAGQPREGVPVYVFSPSGAYLGRNGITDAQGQVLFRLPEGAYDFRADCLGSRFWARDRQLTADTITDVDIAVGGGTFQLGLMTDTNTPLSGVKCYLFDANDAYLGLTAATSDAGTVSFDLADGTYRFRADYLGHHFWSEVVTVAGSGAHDLVIPETPVTVQLTSAQAPAVGSRIYLFSANEVYLGRYETTDEAGQVRFDLPTGIACRFRADLLGNHFWSDTVDVVSGMAPVVIDAGGGRLQVSVQSGTGVPFEGIDVYLFGADGTYLNHSGQTDAVGQAAFEVPDAAYRLRADHLGHSFWLDDILVTADTDAVLEIPLQSVNITVLDRYQGLDRPLAGIPVYLFSPTGAYLGRSAATDDQGRVAFDLPAEDYTVRADVLGEQYWSEPFSWTDTEVRIPMAAAEVTVTGAGLPATGVNVYLFSQDDAYLGQVQSTDDQGTVRFHLPARSARFRADYQGKRYWSGIATLSADSVNPVLISVGGGIATLTVQTGDGTPLAGINAYVFSDGGAYLGLKGATSEDGTTGFELAGGDIRYRADYLGYQYWSPTINIPAALAHTLTIGHGDVAVMVRGSYLGDERPLEGLRVYLFSPSGAYLGRQATTDAAGRVVLNLPDRPYRVRCDYLGQQYWSADFQSADVLLTIGRGQVVVGVTRSGQPAANARVYLFDALDRYLGRYENTDTGGSAAFVIPAGQYRLRADLAGHQVWSDTITVDADSQTAVNVVME